ncbi:MAG: hypothetical protein ACI93R_004115 [Flavobacteriales bacterium]|jgi:hypothetical protein
MCSIFIQNIHLDRMCPKSFRATWALNYLGHILYKRSLKAFDQYSTLLPRSSTYMEVRHVPKDPFTLFLFWDRYREILIRNTLKPDVLRWYVAHVEKYIHACGGTKFHNKTHYSSKTTLLRWVETLR